MPAQQPTLLLRALVTHRTAMPKQPPCLGPDLDVGARSYLPRPGRTGARSNPPGRSSRTTRPRPHDTLGQGARIPNSQVEELRHGLLNINDQDLAAWIPFRRGMPEKPRCRHGGSEYYWAAGADKGGLPGQLSDLSGLFSLL